MGSVVKRLRERLNRPVSLKRKPPVPGKVRTRPTSSGWGFFTLIFCGFLMSVNFSNNLIFAMTFLLVSIALVSWYHTRMNVRGLVFADWRSDPVFAGQEAVYRLAVENQRGGGRHGLQAAARKCVDEPELHLAKGMQSELLLKRPAQKRGLLRSLPATIRSSFPLGIFSARMASGSLPECLVYPAPQGDQPISDLTAGTQAHLSAESGTYTDMRRYSPGDPLSRIAWKALARFDELYTKEFDGAQGQPAIWLRWDDVQAAGAEAKLSQLCRWVLDTHKKNREWGLEIPGTRIGPAKEASHLRGCLEALALYGEPEHRL